MQAELASFVKTVAKDRVLTVALRGLAKFAHASLERQQLFERLQRGVLLNLVSIVAALVERS